MSEKSKINASSKLLVDKTAISMRVAVIATISFAVLFALSISSLPSLTFLNLVIFPAFTITLSVKACKFYFDFEISRAENFIDDEFVKNITRKNFNLNFAPFTVSHLVKHPLAVLKLLNHPNAPEKLKQELFEKFCKLTNFKNESKNQTTIFKIYIDKGYILNDKQISSLISDDSIDCLEIAFARKAIDLKALSENEQHKYLNLVESSKTLELLIKYGFNIESVNEKRETALITALKTSSHKLICLLLSHGAKLPDENIVKTIGENQPFLNSILRQAKSCLEVDVKLCPVNHTISLFNFRAPIVSLDISAVKVDIIKRTVIVFVGALVIGLGFSAIVASPLPSLASFVVTPIYYKWEWSRSTHVINELVKQEFAESKFPRSVTFEYVVKNQNLLNELVKNPKSMLRLNDLGEYLYQFILKDYIYDLSDKEQFSSFKKITKTLFKNSLANDEKYHFLRCVVESGKFGLIKYVLNHDLIKAGDLSESQKSSWDKQLDSQVIKLLKEKGLMNC